MSELVERTGTSAATIRYYLLEGLLPAPSRVSANRFLYDERHVEAVRLVRLLRERRGLTLGAIRDLLPDLLPDLLGRPDAGAFRPEMWEQVLSVGGGAPGILPVADRLRAAGLGAFSRIGYADVTIDEVCRAADAAKGTFYRHFASKEELFFAVVSEVAKRAAHGLVQRGGERGGHSPVTTEQAAMILSEELVPYLSVVLDLCSLAAQGRKGYAGALASLVDEIYEAAYRLVGLSRTDLARWLFGGVLGEAVQAATGQAETEERSARTGNGW